MKKFHLSFKKVYKEEITHEADATYYIDSLSGHISYFNSFSNIVSGGIQVIVFISFLTYNSFGSFIFGILLILLYYPTKLLLVNAMENSFEYSFSVRYIQRIIDNLFLVKILNTEKFEVINFENNITNLNNAERKKFVVRYKFNNSKFCCGFFFFLICFRNQQDNLNLEFIGINFRLMQSVGSMNSFVNVNQYMYI